MALKETLTESTFGEVKALKMGRNPIGLLPPLRTVYCYTIDGLMVDTGLARMRHEVMAFARNQQVEKAVVTHHHEDHSGNTHWLDQEGVPVFASNPGTKILAHGFGRGFYQRVVWGLSPPGQATTIGSTIETTNCKFEVMEAPGHCDDQVVLFEPNKGWLFSGDVFVAEKIKFFRADEDFEKTLTTLRQLAVLPFEHLFCAHSPVLQKGPEALQRKLQFLETLKGAVLSLHEKGLPEKEILHRTLGKEDFWMAFFTAGDFCKRNLIRSIIHGPVPRADIAHLY